MELIFHDKGNEGGIYKILNLQNGRIYIGSTYRFKDRARGHKTELEAGRHLNKFLQNDYNKCGSEVFLFEVIETVMGDRKTRVEREQFHIDQWYDNQKNCYNLVPYAMDSRGGSRNKKQIDPLTDGRCKPFNEERRAKHTAKLKEVWQTPELKEQSRQNAYKQWQEQSQNNITVTNKETGEKVVISGSVRQFCLDRGLSYKAFHQLVKGKLKSSGGWFVGEQEPEYTSKKGQVRKPLSKEHKEKISGGKYVGLKLVNHEGLEIVLTSNVKQQCKDLGLPYSTLIKVLNGKCKSVFGYALAIETR
jgi:group I intron endonuclease